MPSRRGTSPSNEYPVIGTLNEEERVAVVGKAISTYWIAKPDETEEWWVDIGPATVSEATASLPVFALPTIPTISPPDASAAVETIIVKKKKWIFTNLLEPSC